jgi:hypothetical protein
MFLIAEGTDNGDGSITATEVKAADPDGFFGGPGFRGPGFAPGRHGLGFGFGPGFDRQGENQDATASPDDASAS